MKKWTILSSLLVIFALVLGACADTNNTGDDTSLEGTATEIGLDNGNANANANANDDGDDSDDADVNANTNANANANGNEGVEATAAPTLSATEVVAGTTDEAIVDEDDPSRASNLLDFVVKNYEEETIGEVADLVVDADSEQITYVVVEFGGFLGLGESQVAIPYTAMTLGAESGNANANANANNSDTATTGTFDDENAFYLDIDEETLGSAPTVDLEDLDFTIVDWDTEFATWWANFEAGVIEATDGEDDNDANANANVNDDGEDDDDAEDNEADDDDADENEAATMDGRQAVTPVAILMTSLLDAEVVNGTAASLTSGESTDANDNANANANANVNANSNTNASDTTAAAEGEEMGFVTEVIVEPTTGAVEYVVVEAGEELDLEATAWIPVPLSQLEIVLEDAGDDDYVVFIQREMLAGAPSFEIGNLPAFEADWDAGLRDYWHTQ